MTIRDSNGKTIACKKCGSEDLYWYDGLLGYESIKCRQCEHDQNDPADPVKVSLLYRDADNYKSRFEWNIEREVAEKLKEEDTFEMGEHGTWNQEMFFGSHLHQHEYNDEYDHNILEVEEVHL